MDNPETQATLHDTQDTGQRQTKHNKKHNKTQKNKKKLNTICTPCVHMSMIKRINISILPN
jgi:hypothetical protein